MHLEDGTINPDYTRYVGRKILFIAAGSLILCLIAIYSLSLGAAELSLLEVLRSMTGAGVLKQHDLIVWNIRLPQILAAVVAGAGLAVSGGVMQSVLRNPLGSPFTLGISHAAAFGAALAVMVLDSGVMSDIRMGAITLSSPGLTTLSAFVFSLGAALVIVAVSKMRGASPEAMVLSGVALGALFTAGTMFLQFFADDVQLAAMVFWTFGDTARANWTELGILTTVTTGALAFFILNCWNYNAVDAGDETARGLGVRVARIRLAGMLIASLVTAVSVAFLGIIGFVGLVAPHMVRRLIGADNRFLLPATAVTGAGLLLVSDTVARLILAPHLVPVSILTAFMGAPVFIYLIVRGQGR